MAELTEAQELPLDNPELAAALEKATTKEEIRELMWAEAEKNGFSRPGHSVAPPLIAEEKEEKTETAKTEEVEDAPAVYKEEIVIGGQTYQFEGDSVADVLRQIKAANSAHNAATAKPEVKTETKTAPTNDEKVALELDYRMGKISIDTYLEKTGALDAYLEKKGIPVGELKEIVNKKVTDKVAAAWDNAADEFKTANPDYVPNKQNQTVMGMKLAELNLREPTAANLTRAYEALKADGLLFNTVAETAAVVQPTTKKKLQGSSMFGVGGQGGDTSKAVTTKTAGVPKITPDMTPQQIMRAMTTAAQESGLNPDDVIKQYSR
jgi:hypothetical protein